MYGVGVLYGQFAEKVHGGQLVNHCLKFWLYSCICACGFVSGPTRRAIRETYSLPVEPGFLSGQGNNADCLTGTIPCVNCLALCQDAREVNSRGVSSPIKPVEFSWAPVSADNPAQAPAQAEMQK